MNSLFQVLYEDNHLLVVTKFPGVLSQGDRTGDLSLVDAAKSYLKAKYDKPGDVYLGLVHRLDRPTGGVVVLARTSKAAARLSRQFQSHEVDKFYLALCEGAPMEPRAECVHYLLHEESLKKTKVYDQPRPGAKKAVLRYRRLASNGTRSLLQVELLTGRKHQIRAQLSKVGLPILGDRKYASRGGGSEVVPEFGLWAYRVRLVHPVKGEAIEFQSLPSPLEHPLWSDFAETIKNGF